MGSDVSLFNFYVRYKWKSTDFADFQTWLFSTIESIREGGGGGVLTGLIPTIVSGMTLRFPQGAALNSAGRMLLTTGNSDVAIATPVGNPARTLIVLRPVNTDTDDVPNPLNPAVNVKLHTARTATVVVIDGVAGASPAYPAITAGDLILAGLLIPAGTVTVTLAMLETYKREVRRKKELKIRLVTADYTVDPDADEIVEVDDTSGNVNITVPTAAALGQRQVDVIKVAGANTTALVGTVSGLVNPELDTFDCWQIYSNGTALRKRN